MLSTRGVPAWRAWDAEARASAAELSAEVARARDAVAGSSSIRDSLNARMARLAVLDSVLLDGDASASIAAALAEEIAVAAEESGVRLGTVQAIVDSGGRLISRAGGRTGLLRVKSRTDVTADIGGLAALLAWLEEAPPLLAVRELSVTQPEPGAPDGQPEALRVSLLIEGLGR